MSNVVSGPSVIGNNLLFDKNLAKNNNYLEELHFGKPLRRHVEEFALLFAIIFALLGAWLCYRGKPWNLCISLAILSVVLPILGYKATQILYPVWKYWMKLAHYLGLVMTFLLVALCWFLVLAPSAMMLKAIGKKVMDLRYKADVDTYWEDRKADPEAFKKLERQF